MKFSAKSKRANSRSGFTFVELMLVIVVSGILVSVAIPSYVDFRREGNITSSRAFASNLRSAVIAKKTQAALQCNRQLAEANPTIESVRAGDITVGGDCTAEQITDADARKFLNVPTFSIPTNPANGLNTIVECSCTDICDAACQGLGGYCYNRSAMLLWAPGLEPSCGEISYLSSSTASGEGASSSDGSSDSETSSETSSDESCGDEGTEYAEAYDEDSAMTQCFAYATFCGVTTPSVVDASYCVGGSSSSSAESSDGGFSISCTIYEHDIEGQESSDGFLLSGSCTPNVLVTDEGGYNTNPCASGSYRMLIGTDYSEQLITLFQGEEQVSTTCPAFVSSSSSSEDHGDPAVTVDVCNYLSGETDTTDLAGTCSNEGEEVEIQGTGGGSATCSGGAWSVQVDYILPTGVSIMSGAATAPISMETCTDLAGGSSSSECTGNPDDDVICVNNEGGIINCADVTSLSQFKCEHEMACSTDPLRDVDAISAVIQDDVCYARVECNAEGPNVNMIAVNPSLCGGGSSSSEETVECSLSVQTAEVVSCTPYVGCDIHTTGSCSPGLNVTFTNSADDPRGLQSITCPENGSFDITYLNSATLCQDTSFSANATCGTSNAAEGTGPVNPCTF